METTEILKGETGDSRYQKFSLMSVLTVLFYKGFINGRNCVISKSSVIYFRVGENSSIFSRTESNRCESRLFNPYENEEVDYRLWQGECWPNLLKTYLGEVSLENPVNYPKVAINECFNSVCFFSYYFNSLSYVILDCVVNVRSSMTAQFSWIFADEYSWVLFNCCKRKQSCGCCWMFPCTFFWKVGLK